MSVGVLFQATISVFSATIVWSISKVMWINWDPFIFFSCLDKQYQILCWIKLHCSMSSSNCCFLTCIQVSQVAGQVVWYSHLFKNFPVCCDPHKGFSTVNEAEGDVFLEFPCFLYDSTNIGNLISGSSAFSKPSLYIWKFLAYVLLKPNLKDFEHSLTSMWNEHNCPVVWTFFGIALLWDWNKHLPFPVL